MLKLRVVYGSITLVTAALSESVVRTPYHDNETYNDLSLFGISG